MELWTYWLEAIHGVLDLLSSQIGLGAGVAIVTLTLLLRIAILPLSWSVAYRGSIRQKKMVRLQPDLQRLKDKFSNQPQLYMQRMMALYQEHGLKPMDGRSILGALAQMPLFIGMFQTLRGGAGGARFLWIQNLSKPDAGLALLAGLTTMLMMMANPDLPEHMRLLMIVVPSILAVMAALKFCSALAIYWTASNCFSAVQTATLHWVVARRIRSGALEI